MFLVGSIVFDMVEFDNSIDVVGCGMKGVMFNRDESLWSYYIFEW